MKCEEFVNVAEEALDSLPEEFRSRIEKAVACEAVFQIHADFSTWPIIANAITTAERIMARIDARWPKGQTERPRGLIRKFAWKATRGAIKLSHSEVLGFPFFN